MKMSLVIKAKEGCVVVLVLVNTSFHNLGMFASLGPQTELCSEAVSTGSFSQRRELDSTVEPGRINN